METLSSLKGHISYYLTMSIKYFCMSLLKDVVFTHSCVRDAILITAAVAEIAFAISKYELLLSDPAFAAALVAALLVEGFIWAKSEPVA